MNPAFEPPSLTLTYGEGSDAQADDRARMQQQRIHQVDLPTREEIVARYPHFESALAIWASGSVVQGWSHANSDLDLYVVTDAEEPFDTSLEHFTRTVSTTPAEIYIVLGQFGAFRADIEVWRPEQIDQIIGRFDAGTMAQTAPELDRGEQDLLYRLASGVTMAGQDWWQERADRLRASAYGQWLSENRKLFAEGFLEDVAGLLTSGDDQSAALAARVGVEAAIEARLAVADDYSINTKWLLRRVQKAGLTDLPHEQAWRLLTMQGATEEPATYAREAARFAAALLLKVEERRR